MRSPCIPIRAVLSPFHPNCTKSGVSTIIPVA